MRPLPLGEATHIASLRRRSVRGSAEALSDREQRSARAWFSIGFYEESLLKTGIEHYK